MQAQHLYLRTSFLPFFQASINVHHIFSLPVPTLFSWLLKKNSHSVFCESLFSSGPNLLFIIFFSQVSCPIYVEFLGMLHLRTLFISFILNSFETVFGDHVIHLQKRSQKTKKIKICGEVGFLSLTLSYIKYAQKNAQAAYMDQTLGTPVL